MASGAERPNLEWRTASDFEKQLDAPASVVWTDVRLEEALDTLSDAHRLLIYRDRRIDPNTFVNLDLSEVPLVELMRQVAERYRFGVGTIGPVIYLGPTHHAQFAATAAAHANDQFAAALKGKSDAKPEARDLQWEELSQPRKLIAELATRNGLRLKNIESIPHDLWRAERLPKMLPGEQLTLLLIGFDLYFRIDPKQQEIIFTRFPKNLTIRREYATARDGNLLAEKLSQHFPHVFFQGNQESILVRGRYEDQVTIRKWIENGGAEPKNKKATRQNNANPANQRLSLELSDVPLKPIMTVLARRLELTLEWHNVSEKQEKQFVSVKVSEVTRDELLAAILEGTGVSFEIQDQRLILRGSGSD